MYDDNFWLRFYREGMWYQRISIVDCQSRNTMLTGCCPDRVAPRRLPSILMDEINAAIHSEAGLKEQYIEITRTPGTKFKRDAGAVQKHPSIRGWTLHTRTAIGLCGLSK